MDTFNVLNNKGALLAIIEAESVEEATEEAKKLYTTEITVTKE